MASSSSYLPLSNRISLLLPLVVFSLFSSSLVASEPEALKGVGPGHSALDVNLTSCERIQVSGYPRAELGKYAHSFKIKLAPLVTLPERLHSKIQGQWSFAMSPYDTQYIDLKFSGQSSGSVTISVTEGSSLFSAMAYSLSCGWTGRDLGSTGRQQLASVLLHQLHGCWCFPRPSYHYFPGYEAIAYWEKNVMYLAFYGSVVGAGSFILHQFSMMVDMILVNFGLSEDMYSPVAILVLVGIAITGAAFGFWTVRKFVVSKDGGVDASVAQFVNGPCVL
ncbi:protein of unknown function (DUF2215) [Raphanus sativus]|nr:protein of unknown function (DUF2215) [Raphanus sativus]